MTEGSEPKEQGARGLPQVVHVGFAGSRRLFDGVVPEGYLERVEGYLAEVIGGLAGELGFGAHHFLCGISQVAIGADFCFTRVLAAKGIPQRIFLPQHRDEYLNAVGSAGVADFSEEERREAMRLLDGDQVIQERVVSEAADRRMRFEETNIEIIRHSDVILCLVREGADGKPGGTLEMISRAKAWNTPLLTVTVGVGDGGPVFRREWTWNFKEGKAEGYEPPRHPEVLREIVIPEDHRELMPRLADVLPAVKAHASSDALRRSGFFKVAARVIIGTHILATMCAVVGLKLDSWKGALLFLLLLEIGLLLWGYFTHYRLHHQEAAPRWALSRLIAEICRSALALGKLHVSPEYLHALPFPSFLKPFLRTVETLHLRDTRRRVGNWKEIREQYVAGRLRGKGGQITFYEREAARANRLLGIAGKTFEVCSRLAIAATVIKLVLVVILLCDVGGGFVVTKGLLGMLAVVLPVLAVAALSLAAANDLEARAHTFEEMGEFLLKQEKRLGAAMSEREYARLVMETETRLLGETVNWFSRRSFTGVA
jgi:hypothetical protein